MKKLLFLLPLLTLGSVAQAQTVSGINALGVCETIVSDVLPEEYRPVESCEDILDKDRFTSLEERLRNRIFNGSRRTQKRASRSKLSGKYIRQGRGALTRSTPAVSGETRRNQSRYQDRTNTVRNYRSRFQNYRFKNGTKEDIEVSSPRANYQQPGYRAARTRANARGTYETTPRWSAEQRNHFRERSYGTNPYNLQSIRSAEQREFRRNRIQNQRVDVQGRILSRTQKWRPGRIIGDLGGDAEWLKEQAERTAELRSKIQEEEAEKSDVTDLTEE